ncbi:MAG: molybdopterin dinucleotide binding domain-containing protein, partial [Deltaproteobacteria bacterium]|nr:molybdopterin dinucleotide binding domain-containing protein [Deltaproteobacteria bacterium]
SMRSLAEHPEGARLLPASRPGGDFAAPPAPPASPAPDQVELLLVDWTFGTEELASYSPLMREAETAPVLLIHPDDAGNLGLGDGSRANVRLPKGSLAVTVKLSAALAPGVVVLPRHRQLDWRKLAEAPVYLSANLFNPVQG